MFLLSRLTSNSKELFVTLLIFSLSSGVLGGLLFYMDSTSSEVLEEMTEFLPVDMQITCTDSFYESTPFDIDYIASVAMNQDTITSTEVVTTISGFDRFYPNSEFQSYVYL